MNPLIIHIRNRIKQDKNLMAAIVGDTGSGKSFASLYLAEKIDSNFNIDRVIFKASDFIQKIKNNEIPRGACIVFDEAAINFMPARNWYSQKNKFLSAVIQAFRFRNYIVLFTLPDLSFIDIHARKMLHYILETDKIDYEHKRSTLKIYALQINRIDGSQYLECPKLPVGYSNEVNKIKRISTGLPSPELVRAYKKKKEQFFQDLIHDVDNMSSSKSEKEVKDYEKY